MLYYIICYVIFSNKNILITIIIFPINCVLLLAIFLWQQNIVAIFMTLGVSFYILTEFLLHEVHTYATIQSLFRQYATICLSGKFQVTTVNTDRSYELFLQVPYFCRSLNSVPSEESTHLYPRLLQEWWLFPEDKLHARSVSIHTMDHTDAEKQKEKGDCGFASKEQE